MFQSFRNAALSLVAVLLFSTVVGVAVFTLTSQFGMVLQFASAIVSFLLVLTILWLVVMAKTASEMESEMNKEFGDF